MTDVTIGANVTTLDAYSFGYCTALKQLSIPEKVTDIHENAFYGTALTDLALNMEEIKDYAFNNRTDLTQITIGKNVKRIGVLLLPKKLSMELSCKTSASRHR